MAAGDGDGWVSCRCGQRHWGLYGAAGLLLLLPPDLGPPAGQAVRVLLQLRAGWTHEGGSWGLPGGARDSHESTVAAALREAQEEAGVEPGGVRVLAELRGVDHGDWSYGYVVAVAGPGVAVAPRTRESDEVRWVPVEEVPWLPLHPGLRGAWDRLVQAVPPA